MKTDTIVFLFKSIKLETIKINKEMTWEEIVKDARKNRLKAKITIGLPNLVFLNIDEDTNLDCAFLGKKLNRYFSRFSKKVIQYILIVNAIRINNYASVDNVYLLGDKTVKICYSEIFAVRNEKLLIDIFANYMNKNVYICYYLLRDMIENLNLYLFFINNKSDNQIQNALHNGFRTTNFKKIIESISDDNYWREQANKIQRIKENCNSFIHKNGLEKLIPNLSYKEFNVEEVFYIVKIFLILVFCYDGKAIRAIDYIDALENGEEPPENSERWVAPIFQNFIYKEFTKKEIEFIVNKFYMTFD